MTIEEFAREIREINAANGWDLPHPDDWDGERQTGIRSFIRRLWGRPKGEKYRIPSFLSLLHSEVSEALEAYREGDRPGFEEELADVFIRLLDLSGGMEIDLEAEVKKKLAKNRERGYRHGGKKV